MILSSYPPHTLLELLPREKRQFSKSQFRAAIYIVKSRFSKQLSTGLLGQISDNDSQKKKGVILHGDIPIGGDIGPKDYAKLGGKLHAVYLNKLPMCQQSHYYFLSVLEFELRTSCLLIYHLSHFASPGKHSVLKD
jgi:hypothetical protein